MKKSSTALLLATGLSAALLLSGCSKSGSAGKTAEGTITGYLIDQADQYVKLGNYKGLSAEELVTVLSDDDLDLELGSRMLQYSVYEEVDRPAESGDTLSLDLTISPEGEESYTQEDYSIEIGMADLGSEFDEAMIGRKKGDTFEETVTFDDLAIVQDWIGKTVSFKATVKSVSTMILPELDEDFVKNNTEYNTVDEYKAAVREELTESYADYDRQMVMQTLMTDAEAVCAFTGYPDAVYDGIADQIHTQYEQFADSQALSMDELYEYMGMTKEDVENEIIAQVNHRLFLSALCQEENLALTDETYKEFLEKQAHSNGYEDAEAFEKEYGKTALIWSAYDTIVGDFLYKNANITKTVNDYTAADMGTDFLTDFEGETSLEIDGLNE